MCLSKPKPAPVIPVPTSQDAENRRRNQEAQSQGASQGGRSATVLALGTKRSGADATRRTRLGI